MKPLMKLLLLVHFIQMYNNIRERHYLRRRAIVEPRLSAWQHLLSYADEGSFLDVTGFNFASFRSLVTIVFDDELGDELQGRRKRGRPRSLDYSGRVGLVVFFLGSTLMTKHLCLIFGIVPSVANEEIHEMLERLVLKLKRNHHARVKFPDVNECRHLAELVRRREPLVPDVIGFTDGLKCTVQCGSDAAQQDLDYCGYGQDTFCNNIFLFGSDGKIKYGSVNNPGSWHDSPCSTTLRAKCIEKIKGTFKVCVDQGFKRGGDMWDIFVGPMSASQWSKINPILKPYIRREMEIYISLRQASEWGMRALQGTFARLKTRLTSNRELRKTIITSIVLLHNYRTEFVGLNQIATVFNRHYEGSINLDGYDRIGRYFDRFNN